MTDKILVTLSATPSPPPSSALRKTKNNKKKKGRKKEVAESYQNQKNLQSPNSDIKKLLHYQNREKQPIKLLSLTYDKKLL